MEAKALERQPDERLLIEAAQSEPVHFADFMGAFTSLLLDAALKSRSSTEIIQSEKHA